MDHESFAFIESIRRRHWLSMLHGVDAVLFHPGGDAEFRRFATAAREYLLADGKLRPQGLTVQQFQLLKPLCENLVASGRFAPARLELFVEQPLDGFAPGRPGA